MPIYEYRCEKCGHEMDALQKISDDPLVDCPACGEPALKKLVSAAGFRLKGSGWYETDFKSGTKKNLHDTGRKETAGKEGGGKEAGGKDGAKKPAGTSAPASKKAGGEKKAAG